MYAAIVVLTAMGLSLGFVLGLAARLFRVEADPVAEKIEALMPGSQCGQCGYPGCKPAAEALARGEASVTLCPPGGRALAEELAQLLGVQADLSGVKDAVPMLARVDEDLCIGCLKCLRACPTDAVIGAAKQIHCVLPEACSGCGKCVDVCPTECMQMLPIEPTVRTWRWPKPVLAAA
ncbi:MAG: electron transport complex subunit RsxB [Chromatiales bacterium]|jgi:electron transport complex protein RnfB|nr:electron transport complex subunit RsxB [Chromatiales bacterium]MDX9765939.1 electron transport complex subunit RsxB [Ectothiorhodospiraceae bacterium]